MRVLIIGSGGAGQYLARKLCEEKHDVVLIDSEEEALVEVQQQLDILTIEGPGSSPSVLQEAEVSKADLVIAVTNNDEANILACVMAHSAGVERTVARVSNTDYVNPPRQFSLAKVGIDLVVSQKEECAHELFNILRMPGALEAVDLLDGRILATGITVHMDSPLIRSTLRDFPKPELLDSIRFITVIRGTEMLVPHGDTQFMVGDHIYFVGRKDDVSDFLEWAWPDHAGFEKIVIAGGGDLGLRLAQLMENAPTEAVLVEQDEEQAHDCSGLLDSTLVIKGNALNQETLENAGIVNKTAFVAVTDSDENNIIGCLLAEKMGAQFTVARVTKPEYVPLVENLSLLDRVVSPPLSMVNAILHFVRGKHVKEAALFHKLPGELIDFVLPEDSKWADRAIKDLKIPEGVIVACVLHDGDVHVATGDHILEAGDRIVLFSLPESLSKIEPLFRK